MHLFVLSGGSEKQESYCNDTCARPKDISVGPFPNLNYCTACVRLLRTEKKSLQDILDDESTPESVGLRMIDRLDSIDEILGKL